MVTCSYQSMPRTQIQTGATSETHLHCQPRYAKYRVSDSTIIISFNYLSTIGDQLETLSVKICVIHMVSDNMTLSGVNVTMVMLHTL